LTNIVIFYEYLYIIFINIFMSEEYLVEFIVLSVYTVIFLGMFIAAYVFNALLVSKIGEKLGREDTWKAWVPIISGAYQLELGDLSPWLYLLIFFPIFGWLAIGILSIVAWVKITEKRGFPTWVGLIIAFAWLIPSGGVIAQYIAKGFVAWGEYDKK